MIDNSAPCLAFFETWDTQTLSRRLAIRRSLTPGRGCKRMGMDKPGQQQPKPWQPGGQSKPGQPQPTQPKK